VRRNKKSQSTSKKKLKTRNLLQKTILSTTLKKHPTSQRIKKLKTTRGVQSQSLKKIIARTLLTAEVDKNSKGTINMPKITLVKAHLSNSINIKI